MDQDPSLTKISKKSDIPVIIRSGTYLPYLNSDIKISDICLKTLYLQGVPKKMVIMSGFEFLTLEGVFLEVRRNSKNFLLYKRFGLFNKIWSKWTLFYSKSVYLPEVL